MPSASDERKALLAWFADPSNSNAFILGSFARHVTAYSQQVRALNLFYALDQELGLAKKNIAIIGAGIAGLTAAAAALFLGAKVTLLDREPDVLTLQKGNSQRWLHPHIYDWPFAEEPNRDAGLPILNWRASLSSEVAGNLREEWKVISKHFELAIDFHSLVTDLRVIPVPKPRLQWSGKYERDFDLLVWAVGFGLDAPARKDNYWALDSIDDDMGGTERWLVSGYGDGALTDLMRLCINNFRHEDILSYFANQAGTANVVARIKEIESHSNRADDQWLTQQYQSLDLPELRSYLEQRRRPNRLVFLAGTTPWRYSRKSSALNKFIVSQLERINAFTPLMDGRWTNYEPSLSGGARVVWPGREEIFHRVVVRHGITERSLPENVRRSSESLKVRWDGLSNREDSTRIPQWPDGYWESKSVMIAENMTRRDQTPAISIVELISKAVMYTRYKDDVARLDEHWKLEAVVSKKTVVVVVGTIAQAEILDRPAAQYLCTLIDKEGNAQSPYHRAVLLNDVAWLDQEVLLSDSPLIAIGGHNANRATKRLLELGKTKTDHSEWAMGEGVKGVFRRVRQDCPQVALYGIESAVRTRRAVEVYIEKREGLQSFLDMCWGADRTRPRH